MAAKRKSSGGKRRKSAGKRRKSAGKRRKSTGKRRSPFYWTLHVTYPMKLYDQMDGIVERILGKTSDGSGAGMGERDLSFYYNTQAAVDRAYEKLERQRRLMVIHGSVRVTTRRYIKY